MHRIITSLVLALLVNFSFTQDSGMKDNFRRKVLKKSYISLHRDRVSLQDVKFSTIPYVGWGGGIAAGTSRESDNYYWNTAFTAGVTQLNTRLFNGKGTNIKANLSFDYTRKLTENYQLGGRWDLANGNMSLFENLGNNSNNLIFNSTLSVLGRYTRKLNDHFNLNFDLSIGLLSIAKESTSFAYSASQKVLEEGVFDFQNTATTSPFSIKYSSIEPIGSLNNVKTSLSIDYKRRWNLSYNWTLFNYRTVKGYPITIATHSIGVRFNYIHKEKIRKAK